MKQKFVAIIVLFQHYHCWQISIKALTGMLIFQKSINATKVTSYNATKTPTGLGKKQGKQSGKPRILEGWLYTMGVQSKFKGWNLLSTYILSNKMWILTDSHF